MFYNYMYVTIMEIISIYTKITFVVEFVTLKHTYYWFFSTLSFSILICISKPVLKGLFLWVIKSITLQVFYNFQTNVGSNNFFIQICIFRFSVLILASTTKYLNKQIILLHILFYLHGILYSTNWFLWFITEIVSNWPVSCYYDTYMMI